MPSRWSTSFDDPIPLANGRALITLKDAARYITRLPPAAQKLEHWQTAAHCLLGAAEGRDFLMHARIGMLRAINHGKPPPATAPRGRRTKVYRLVR